MCYKILKFPGKIVQYNRSPNKRIRVAINAKHTTFNGAEYINYINIKIINTLSVILAIDVTTFYVWCYQDNVTYNGSYKVYFLNDVPHDATDNLFCGLTIWTTRFGGNYNILEPVTCIISWLNLVLGIKNLDGAIRAVYGRQEGQLNQTMHRLDFFLFISKWCWRQLILNWWRRRLFRMIIHQTSKRKWLPSKMIERWSQSIFIK